MKRFIIVLLVVCGCFCACSAYGGQQNDRVGSKLPKTDGKMVSNFGPDPDMDSSLKIDMRPLLYVPGYIKNVYYDPEELYIPEVVVYDDDIEGARMITVMKRLWDKPLWGDLQPFFYYSGTFLSDNNEDIEKMCKMLPLVRRTMKYDRFEILEYDARDKINYIHTAWRNVVFSVVKDRGRIIWYCEGHPFRDIAVTGDGRYMIATDDLVFYTNPEGKRIVSEMYGGNRIFNRTFGTSPNDVRILTDNIVRVAYPFDRVEHWQVRLSEEDVEKNMKKYKTDEKWQADKCLLWSNGKGRAQFSQKMWRYYESEEEPVYKDTNLADPETATVSSYKRPASASASKKQPAQKTAMKGLPGSAGKAVKGFFASLFGKLATVVAAVFA